MRNNPYREDREELNELLRQYENLRSGGSHSFMDEEAFERIIEYFDEKDDFSKALEAAEIGLAYYPYSSLLLIKKADLLLVSHKYAEALDILETVELFDSSDLNLYILKTDAFLALDQQEKAVELLQDALVLFEGEERIDLLFELADVYDDYEEFDKVFDCLKIILEEDPTNEEALYKICFWTDFTGRNEESIRLHKEIIDNYPYNELAWFNLGASFQGLKLYEKAIDAYLYAVTIDEKFDYAYRNMGDAYIRLRNYKGAIEALEKVLELTRPEDIIYEAIGHCYHRLGNQAQARFHYRKASHMNPEDSKLHYKIAVTYMNEQKWEVALRPLEIALRIHPHISEYNISMGECKMNLEKFKEAIFYFTVAVKQRPKNAPGWEALIKCLFKAGFYEEACIRCLGALDATDEKPVFYFYHAGCLFGAGKSKEALLQLEKGMNQAPRLLKKLVELHPSILQLTQVIDLAARFKKNKKK